ERVAINAGGGAAGDYAADQGFSGDGVADSTADPIDTRGVGDPAPQGVYQTYRHGRDFTYQVTGLTAGATYAVRLDFADPTDRELQRFINVTINGQVALGYWDIGESTYVLDPRPRVSVTATFSGVADANGTITLHFTAVSGYDDVLINGIEVSRVVAVTTTD